MKSLIQFYKNIFLETRWEAHAALAALLALVFSLSFLLYPDPYGLSKGYATLREIVPNPRVLGIIGGAPALLVLCLLQYRRAVYPLVAVMLFCIFLFVSNVRSVGVSAGGAIFLLSACASIFAILRSGFRNAT